MLLFDYWIFIGNTCKNLLFKYCLKINFKELIWGMIIVRVFVSTQVCRLSFHYHSIPGGSGTFSVLLVYMKGKATKKDTMNVGLYPRSFQITSGYIIS